MGGRVSRSARDARARAEKEEHTVPVAAHRHSVTCISVFGEDGEVMVTASEDRSLCLWDLSASGKYKKYWQMKSVQGHGLQAQNASDAPAHRRMVDSLQKSAMVRCPQPGFARDGHSHWVCARPCVSPFVVIVCVCVCVCVCVFFCFFIFLY